MRKVQRVAPEKTKPFELDHPSGDAKATGTPITIKKETAIKAKTAT
jgi:hypothetical protein